MHQGRSKLHSSSDEPIERQYRDLLDGLADAVLVHDGERVDFANRAAAALVGADSADALMGLPLARILDPASIALISRCLGGPSEPLSSDGGLVRADGTALRVTVSMRPVEWDGHAAVQVICTTPARARTTPGIAAAELRQRQYLESLSTLAAGVAHEVNNPLTYVLANLDVMSHMVADDAGPVDRPEMRELLAEAIEGADRIRRVVGELNSFSRQKRERATALDVRRPLESAVRIARYEIVYRARLTEEYGEVPRIVAEESRLGQVFVNLLINAAQAIPAGDVDNNEIAVRTWHDGAGWVMIEISDTGCGIEPDMLERIFEPYVTTRSIDAGKGLGLTVSYGIIDSFGGVLSVESEVGVGSTFRIKLPVAPEDALRLPYAATAPSAAAAQAIAPPPAIIHAVPAVSATTELPAVAPPAAAAIAPASITRPRILIVDDELSVRRLLTRVLADHDVSVVSTGRDAVDRLASESFDLILCDLIMPQQTGKDVYEAMQRMHPGQEARIVFMTGGAFTPWAQDFLTQVPNRRIEKPFNIMTIRQLVAEVGTGLARERRGHAP